MNLEAILAKVGFSNITPTGKWLQFSCPLAPYSPAHKHSLDINPSAGAFIADNGVPVWNCFCCGGKGTLTRLLEKLTTLTGANYSSTLEELESGIYYKDYDSIYTSIETPIPKSASIPLYVYESVFSNIESSQQCVSYLYARGIDIDTANKLQLRFAETQNRVIFPYIDSSGQLYGYSGRDITNSQKPKVLNSKFTKETLFLGEHLWGDKPTILVEGLFAYARLHQLGFSSTYDIAALSGVSMSTTQQNILITKDLPVILFLDGDAPGIVGANKIANSIKDNLLTARVEYGDIKDIDLLTRAEIYDMVKNANIAL